MKDQIILHRHQRKNFVTEGDIKDYVKNHYNNELMRIGRFKNERLK